MQAPALEERPLLQLFSLLSIGSDSAEKARETLLGRMDDVSKFIRGKGPHGSQNSPWDLPNEIVNVGAPLVKSAAQINAAAASGQPPALLDIPSEDLKNLYWQSGLIDAVIANTANVAQCGDFWFGDQDGDSGGMNSCNMTGQMGFTFSPIMQAGVSLCYLQALPKPELFTSGAVQVISGQIPTGALANMFDPGTDQKILKLQISGPQPALLYVRVYSGAENAQAGYQFHADIWQCGNESNQAVLRHSIVVDNTNQYLYGFYSHQNNFSGGGHQFVVDAGLSLDGDGIPGFDLTKDRHAVAEHLEADGTFGFRQDIRITPQNLLKIKSRWLFPYGWRKDYSVSRFSGTNIRDLRLYEGGIKAEDHNNGEPQYDSLVGMEFRDTAYFSAPSSAAMAEANSLDFSTDPILATAPSVQIDTSQFLCDVTPNLTLLVHADNPTVATLFSNCDQFTMWNTNFCAQDATLSNAQTQWEAYCAGLIAGG